MSEQSAPKEEMKRLEIRKYPNRRYYDSSRSRHVTLDEIYQLIRDGYEVTVTDSQSGQDITARVLAQIIIDLDTQKLGVFPVPMLHRLLRSNEQLVQDFVSKYFSQPLMSYLDSRRNMEQYFPMMEIPPSGPTVADWAKLMVGAMPPLWGVSRSEGMGSAGRDDGREIPPERGPATPPPPPPAAAAETADSRSGAGDYGSVVESLRQMVGDLRAELTDLRSQLQERQPKRPPGAKGRRAKKKVRRR